MLFTFLSFSRRWNNNSRNFIQSVNAGGRTRCATPWTGNVSVPLTPGDGRVRPVSVTATAESVCVTVPASTVCPTRWAKNVNTARSGTTETHWRGIAKVSVFCWCKFQSFFVKRLRNYFASEFCNFLWGLCSNKLFYSKFCVLWQNPFSEAGARLKCSLLCNSTCLKNIHLSC